MNYPARVLCVLTLGVVVAGAAAAAPASGRKLYRWTDAHGEVHYGDLVPPEYAGQEQSVINSQGMVTEHLDAQKSAEQAAADEQKRLEARQRAARDGNLLNTYASVQEIERLRDQRLGLLTDQIKVTGQFLETLDGRMKKLRVTSLHFKPYSTDVNAPPMPDQVAEDLVRVANDIHTQEENLREKRSEEAIMSKEFATDIARFKELKGIH